MELFKHKEACCGCGACYAVCSDLAGAIRMVPDEEGFLYPVVDWEACIRCRRCLQVCPFKDAVSD